MQRRLPIFLFCSIVFSVLLAFAPATRAARSKHVKPPKPVPAPNALDGKSFVGALTETGVTKGRQETLEFKGGRLVSSNCAKHGFAEVPYFCSRRADGSLRFTVESSTAKSGILHCDAVIYGNRLDGVITWADAKDTVHTYGVHALAQQPRK